MRAKPCCGAARAGCCNPGSGRLRARPLGASSPAMLFVVCVDQPIGEGRSDPWDAATALRIARQWQAHGDVGVRVESLDGAQTWTLSAFGRYVAKTARAGG